MTAPGPLRWKFDGGRGAMLDEDDQIVGYWNPRPLDPVKVAEVIQQNCTWTKIMDDGYPSTGFNTPSDIARALCEAYTEGRLT